MLYLKTHQTKKKKEEMKDLSEAFKKSLTTKRNKLFSKYHSRIHNYLTTLQNSTQKAIKLFMKRKIILLIPL